MRRSSMWCSFAAANTRASVSPCPRRKNSGQTSLATSASTTGNSADQAQRARSPHTAATKRPPGRNTRRISATPRSGSGRYIRPSAHSATSTLASGSASVSASMRWNSTFDSRRRSARCRAASTICPDRSTPSTRPCAPTASAAAKVTRPVPQATSSTCSPERSAAMASSSVWAGSNCDCHRAS